MGVGTGMSAARAWLDVRLVGLECGLAATPMGLAAVPVGGGMALPPKSRT